MQLRSPRLSAPLLIALATACNPTEAPPPANASLLLRGAIHYTDDVGGFLYTVVGVDCDTGARLADVEVQSATVRADAFYLPSGEPGLGSAQGPVYGDHTFVLAPGCYDVSCEPLRGGTDEPSEYCLPAHARAVQVAEGLTTEVLLISQCPGPARSFEDVAPETNEPPAIAMTIAGPEEPIAACEGIQVCVNALDPDGDPIEFVWEVIEGAPEIPPSALVTTREGDGSLTQCAVTKSGSLAAIGLGVSAYDLARDADRRPLRIDDLLRQEGAAGSRASAEIPLAATEPCSVGGRSLTLLFTLHGPEGRAMPAADARRLAANAARWVGAVDAPRVLVVRDQNHRGEDLDDVDRLVDDLRAELGAASVDRVDEEDLPSPGDLQVADLEGYDVVWLANPGAPIDSLATFDALLEFRGDGGGVVLQGDDLAHFQTPTALADALTFARFKNGGASACGRPIDGWGEHAYRVDLAAVDHPVLAGLAGTFAYANDVDHVEARGLGEITLATAAFAADGCEITTPAIIAVDPALLIGEVP